MQMQRHTLPASVDPVEKFLGGVCKAATTQILQEVGYNSTHISAVDSLSDIVIKCTADLGPPSDIPADMEELGQRAGMYASAARRSEATFADMLQALQDAGVSAEDLYDFFMSLDEIPFCSDMPDFPLPQVPAKRPREEDTANGKEEARMDQKEASTSAQQPQQLPKQEEAMPSRAHIPAYLPPFPDPHTFRYSPAVMEAPQDEKARRKIRVMQVRQVESSLIRLQRAALADHDTDGFGQYKNGPS